MIENMSTRCQQRMGVLYRVRDFLCPRHLPVAFKSFVRPVCEYGSVAVMGAAATHLMQYRQWLRNRVNVHFPHCIFAVRPVLWAYFVSCLISEVEGLYSSFVRLCLWHILIT